MAYPTPTQDLAMTWIASYRRAFTAADLQRDLGLRYSHAITLLSVLRKRGKIERVKPGQYRIVAADA